MNIFVSGASGVVGYGVLKTLINKGFDLFSSTIYDHSAAQKFGDHFIKAIPTTDEHYLDWLISTFKEYNIDIAFPGIDADLYFWNENREKIEESGVSLILNNSRLIDLCKDKWKFFLALTQANSACRINSTLENDFDLLKEQFGLPFLLKPRQGFGSNGIIKVFSEEDYLPYRSDLGDVLMAQEYIGSDEEEYTVAAFGDGKGKSLNMFSMKRTLSKDGYTQRATVVDNEPFETAINELSDIFDPLGPTNYQFRLSGGQLKLLEINPRMSSSSSIRSQFGYNEAMMAIEFYKKHSLPIQPKTLKGEAIRYVEDLIFLQ